LNHYSEEIILFLIWYHVSVLRCWRSVYRASCVPRSAPASRWVSPACRSATTMKWRFWLAVRAAGFSAVRLRLEGHTQEVSSSLVLIMVALVVIGQTIIFLPCGFYLLSSFFPRLISAVGGWMSTILPHMVWP